MLIKALVLLSGSFFAGGEMQGILWNGYVTGVVSLAPAGMWEQLIWFEQAKLLQENAETVSLSNFLAAFWGGGTQPVMKIGIALSGFRREHWILSLYFTGMIRRLQ